MPGPGVIPSVPEMVSPVCQFVISARLVGTKTAEARQIVPAMINNRRPIVWFVVAFMTTPLFLRGIKGRDRATQHREHDLRPPPPALRKAAQPHGVKRIPLN